MRQLCEAAVKEAACGVAVPIRVGKLLVNLNCIYLLQSIVDSGSWSGILGPHNAEPHSDSSAGKPLLTCERWDQ